MPALSRAMLATPEIKMKVHLFASLNKIFLHKCQKEGYNY